MIRLLVEALDKVSPVDTVSAHCDIPCKIYDPAIAQVAALSVIRFLDLIQELEGKETLSVSDIAQLSRLTREKEIHAAKVKEEVRVIWGDYFKTPQFEAFPDTHTLVHNIMLTASKCKQHTSRDHGEALLTLVNEFAASFWSTKGVDTYSAVCPYPPSEKVTYPKLDAAE